MLNRSLSKPRDTPAMVPWHPGLCHSLSHRSKASWACNSIRMWKMCMLPSLPPRAWGTTWPTPRHREEGAVCSQAEFGTSEDLLQHCQWQADISQPLAFHLTLALPNSWEKQSDVQKLHGEGWSWFTKDIWVAKKSKNQNKFKKRHSLLNTLEYSADSHSTVLWARSQPPAPSGWAVLIVHGMASPGWISTGGEAGLRAPAARTQIRGWTPYVRDAHLRGGNHEAGVQAQELWGFLLTLRGTV